MGMGTPYLLPVIVQRELESNLSINQNLFSEQQKYYSVYSVC